MAYSNIIDYVNIASTGNATDFGDLLEVLVYHSACSNGTRGIFTGGNNSVVHGTRIDVIQYVTIDTTGNSIDFGDLTSARDGHSAVSDGTKGLTGGGNTGSEVNTIDYVNIASLGNSSDFGDLTLARDAMHASSGD